MGTSEGVKVYNMANPDEFVVYQGVPPRQAVRNAHAQMTLEDYNIWEYEKYDKLVSEGEYFYFCGQWATYKEEALAKLKG